MDWGMQSRLSHLIQPDGRCLFMPIDHGYFQGPTRKLEKPGKTIKPLLPYCDAIFVTRGVLRSSIAPEIAKPVILRVSGGTSVIGHDLADEDVTTSMEEAIRETMRRRRIQEAYNREHHITPQTIVKPVDDELARVCSGDYVDLTQDMPFFEEFRSVEEVEEEITTLEEKMHEAAEKYEFEQAAAFRDRIKELFPGLDHDVLEKYDRRLKVVRTNEHKLIHVLNDTDELYDLSSDPGELNNIIHQRQDVAEDLRAKLMAWENSFKSEEVDSEVVIDEGTKRRLRDLGYIE